MTADEVKNLLQDALDGIELLDNTGREELLRWADARRDLGIWGLPGAEIMIGVHNKCVFECLRVDPSWKNGEYFVL